MRLRKKILMCIIFSVLSFKAFCEVDFNLWLNFSSSPSVSYLNPRNFIGLKDTWSLEYQVFLSEKFSLFEDRFVMKFSDSLSIYPKGGDTSVTNRITELWCSLFTFDWLLLTVGKEVVRSGVGYFKNPSDFLVSRFLSKKSKSDTDKYLEGRFLVDLLGFFDVYSIQLIFSPKIVWNDESKQVLEYLFTKQEDYKVFSKFSGNFWGIDFSTIFCYDEKFNLGINLAYVIGENLEIHFEGAIADRGIQKFLGEKDVIIDIGGIPTKVGVTNTLEEREVRWVPEVVLGTHYTFVDEKLTIMFEYFYNGIGLDREEWFKTLDRFEEVYNGLSVTNSYSPTDFLLLASLNTFKMFVEYYGFTKFVKHYGMLRIHKKFEIPLEGEVIVVKNLVDFSGLVLNRFIYDFKIGTFEFLVSFPYGSIKSEFGLIVENFSFGASLKLMF